MKLARWAMIVGSALAWCGLPVEASASVRAHTEAEVCAAADIVLIGTVTQRTSAFEQTPRGTLINSTVVFQVERMIHGPNVSTITIKAPGGEVDGRFMLQNGMSVMQEDERYLLMLRVVPNSIPRILGSGLGAQRLDPEASLPTLADLQSIYADKCNV